MRRRSFLLLLAFITTVAPNALAQLPRLTWTSIGPDGGEVSAIAADQRDDMGAVFGAQFATAGFHMTIGGRTRSSSMRTRP